MEYSTQRLALRCPHAYSDPSTWSTYHASDVWQRFVSRTMDLDTSRQNRKRRQQELFELAEKQDLVEELLHERLPMAVFNPANVLHEEGEAYDEGDEQQTGIIYSYNNPSSSGNSSSHDNFFWGETEDSLGDDDSDDDGDDTIYSNCLGVPTIPSQDSSEVSSSVIPRKGDTSCDSDAAHIVDWNNVRFQSFDWADEMEDSETAEEISELARDFSSTRESSDTLFLPSSKNNELDEAVVVGGQPHGLMNPLGDYHLLGYGIGLPAPGCLGECRSWRLSPLEGDLEHFSAYGYAHVDSIPAVNYIPAVVITDENRTHFRALEVKNPLSEEAIAAIRLHREGADTETREQRATRLEWHESFEPRKSEKELSAAAAARLWWATEQQKRDAEYGGWEAEEANECNRLRNSIRMQVDKIFAEQQEVSDKQADSAREHKWKRASEGLERHKIDSFALLSLRIRQDGLQFQGDGRWSGPHYSVQYTNAALHFLSCNRQEIEGMATVIHDSVNSPAVIAVAIDAAARLQHYKQQAEDKLLDV